MERASRGHDQSPLRVLLVDDCEVNRLLSCVLLARWGITPTVACDGQQAVRLVSQHVFDLVLMDVEMPVMDGLIATEQIRHFERAHARRPLVPVVAFTGSTLADEAQLRASGINELLKKPCSPAAMAECLLRHCADKFAHRLD